MKYGHKTRVFWVKTTYYPGWLAIMYDKIKALDLSRLTAGLHYQSYITRESVYDGIRKDWAAKFQSADVP
jgi:hypothetical protein